MNMAHNHQMFPHQRRRSTLGIAAIAATAVVASLSGCSAFGGGSTAAEKGSGSTIRVQVETVKVPGFQAVVDLFQKANPGNTVKLETITSDQKATTNSLTLASANAPDLGLVPLNATSYTQLLKGKALLPLDDVWGKANLEKLYGPDIAPRFLDSDGKPYATLFEKTIYNTVYYNSELFLKLGITPPKDHQLKSNNELYSIVNRLHDNKSEALCMGGTSNYQMGWLLDAQLAAYASPDALKAYTDSGRTSATGKVDYTDDAFVKPLAQIREWKDKGVFQAGVLGQNYDTALANFVAGKCGMLLGQSNTTTALVANKIAFKYDWLLMPGIAGPTLPNTYAGSTFVVPKTASNPDLAKKFLEFFFTQEAQIAYIGTNGSLPAISGLPADKLAKALPPHANDIFGFVAKTGASLGWTSVVPGALGQGFIDPEIQKMLTGSLTPAQVGENQQLNYEKFKKANA